MRSYCLTQGSLEHVIYLPQFLGLQVNINGITGKHHCSCLLQLFLIWILVLFYIILAKMIFLGNLLSLGTE